MEHIIWRVSPAAYPKIIRCCKRCAHMSFLNSGQFRVNANGHCLDVWLIYKCESCEATWNMEIMPMMTIETALNKLLTTILPCFVVKAVWQ